MSRNRPILITGTQRSGTTLLNLMLDSHPAIRAIDETEFNLNELPGYLSADRYHPCVAFKLPMYAHALHEFPGIGDMKVLWCVRDPRAVVASMLRLRMLAGSPGSQSISWAVNPYGAVVEVYKCALTLSRFLQRDVMDVLGAFPRIAIKPPLLRTRQEAVYTAALCWQLKNLLLPHYQAASIPLRKVVYEELTVRPREVAAELLEFLELPWHDDVLRHHELHEGTSVGATRNTRAIDDQSRNKWQSFLTQEDLDIITTLCGSTAQALGYDLGAEVTD